MCFQTLQYWLAKCNTYIPSFTCFKCFHSNSIPDWIVKNKNQKNVCKKIRLWRISFRIQPKHLGSTFQHLAVLYVRKYPHKVTVVFFCCCSLLLNVEHITNTFFPLCCEPIYHLRKDLWIVLLQKTNGSMHFGQH